MDINLLNQIAPKLSTFQEAFIHWLVPDLIPFGAITMVDGDPGGGKSNFAHWLAATASNGGQWHDGRAIPQVDTVIIDCENSIGGSVRNRIIANGGELPSVRILSWFIDPMTRKKTRFKLPEHLEMLEDIVSTCEAKLVIIDTMMNHLDRSLNSNGDQDVREALTPLAEIASRLGIAILILRHLNKAAMGSPLYRGSGSIGFAGVSRSVILIGKDPSFPKRRILCHVKTNDQEESPSVSFTIEKGEPKGCFLKWGEIVEITPAELLGGITMEENSSALDRAEDELKAMLKEGGKRATELFNEAKSIGISIATLRRAQKALKIDPQKIGKGEGSFWFWELPADKPTLMKN